MREKEKAIRERLPSLGSDHAFEPSVVISRNVALLSLDTFKAIDPLHKPARHATIMFITPVSNRLAPHEENPFTLTNGMERRVALKQRDKLADYLLKMDYSFLNAEDPPKPVNNTEVFENGLNSVDLLIDDGRITGLYSICVFPEHIEQLAVAFRNGHFGYFFCPAIPRDEPPGTLHASVAVEKYRGRTLCMPGDVIYELFHQYKIEFAYFITDNRAFKGQYIYMFTCISEAHRDWCLRNPLTLLGDEQFDAFRHKPAQGVNVFFISGALGVTDANLRLKPDLAGFLHLPTSEVNFFKVTDLVSKNVVILRAETRDDAASVAQVNALLSRGVILSTAKPGKPTISYAKSHPGSPFKFAATLEGLQRLMGHVIMKTPVPTDPEDGEEIDLVRAAPGTVTQRADELEGILAAGPPSSPSANRQTRRRRPNPADARAQPPSASAGGSAVQANPAQAGQARQSLAARLDPSGAQAPAAATVTMQSLSARVAAKLAEGFLMLPESCCPVTKVPLMQDQRGLVFSVGTGKWFEWRADGQLVELVEDLGAAPGAAPPLQPESIQQGAPPETPVDMAVAASEAEEGDENGEVVEEADGDEEIGEANEEESGQGMLFFVEHYFAFKRAVRHWRKCRSPPASSMPSILPARSLIPSGTPTASRSQTFTPAMPLEETRSTQALSCALAAVTSSMEADPGDAPLGRQEQRGQSASECETACDGQGTRDMFAPVPASQCEGMKSTLSLGTELPRGSSLPFGRDYGARLPPAAAQHERRDGVINRKGACVDTLSPRQEADHSAFPLYACLGVQLPATKLGEASAALLECDDGTSRHHAFGQLWRSESFCAA